MRPRSLLAAASTLLVLTLSSWAADAAQPPVALLAPVCAEPGGQAGTPKSAPFH